MIAYFIIALAVVIRVASYSSGFAFFPPNFAPIGGLALFAGAYLTGRKSLMVPLAALLISDLWIGFYNPLVMVSVYGSFFLVVLIGKWLKKNKNGLAITGGAVTSSVLFFLITNFAVWAAPVSYYSPDLSGLIASYIAGIPFFKYTLAGDIFFTGLFFLSYELAQSLAKYLQLGRSGVSRV